ncbi:MAG: hypothetical protein IJV64_09925 [Oscillospiraceae bacterium]|nr:hypothetical protein [Oscillospiraceae bacterium]
MQDKVKLTLEEEARIRAQATMERARERYWALSECLNIIEANVRSFSQNETGLSAREGYELAFQRERRKAECVREMMREARTETGWA